MTTKSTRLLRIEANKERLLAFMRSRNVQVVTISYSGSGDSGNGKDHEGVDQETLHEEVTVTVAKGHYDCELKQWLVAEKEESLDFQTALDEFVEDLIDEHGHSGYENSDGGGGEVVIDAVAGTVKYRHYDYYVECSYAEDVVL